MLSTRDVKRKIRSVRNIEQICRAMKTVAAIKLRRAEARAHALRPYAEHMRRMLGGLMAAEAPHPLLEEREVHRVGIIVIAADRGLCGGYNANLLRRAAAAAAAAPHAAVVPVGRKAADFFRRHARYPLPDRLSPVGDEPQMSDVAALADRAGQRFVAGEWDAVEMVYTHCRHGAHAQVAERLLPLPRGEEEARQFIYEPSPAALLELLLPLHLRLRLWMALLEAKAAEHQARVTAMTQASDNAQDMIESLTLDYNKARQAAITSELLDIVGTAEAQA